MSYLVCTRRTQETNAFANCIQLNWCSGVLLLALSLCVVFQGPWCWSVTTLKGTISAHPCERTHTHTPTSCGAFRIQKTMRAYLLAAAFLLPLVSSVGGDLCVGSQGFLIGSIFRDYITSGFFSFELVDTQMGVLLSTAQNHHMQHQQIAGRLQVPDQLCL